MINKNCLFGIFKNNAYTREKNEKNFFKGSFLCNKIKTIRDRQRVYKIEKQNCKIYKI